ncbi:type II toxin-antitoxin system RelE/ParE family toxin [filamentous cyanobacterium LEGE 07170]|nr:type II toxin-antitoxin system RelE/ParE family toxin [filamentous cyanobacterium LEGE 07170]
MSDRRRIVESLDNLLARPETLDIKPLKGRPERRLRVGKYRILFVVDETTRTYIVTTIAPRGDAYK